jgi:hypothetical protein
VEAAQAQLRGWAQDEEREKAAGVATGTAALALLFGLSVHRGPSAEECRRRVLAAQGMDVVVRFFACSMAAGGSSWQARASKGPTVMLLTSGSLCSHATAAEAVEAGAVPLLLGCLARSGHPDDELVQGDAARALGALAGALCPGSSPGGRRQLPETLRGTLRPAVAALAGLLGSAQLPVAVATSGLRALGNILLSDQPWPRRQQQRAPGRWPSSGPAGRGRRRRWCRPLEGC